MNDGFNKWWLVPFGILAASTLVALGIVVFKPTFINNSFAEVAQRAVSKLSGECTDYACYQARYQDLVRDSGVRAAFGDLKDEYAENEFVKSNCHQLVHVIGRAAAERYGDISSTFSRGEHFCWSGYYHGAMEAVVAKTGANNIQGKINTICADLAKKQRHSFYHYNCVHGLGHGIMGILENELFESLHTCDTLVDAWERTACYSGVFMENIMAQNNSSHPAKYLKADQPLYPCTQVRTRYAKECYKMQTSYALQTQGNDFTEVFDLCAEVEDFQATCYQSLGRDATGQSNFDVAETKATCMLGKNYGARSNCVVGAAKTFVSNYHGNTQAKVLCESFDADLRAACLQAVKEYEKVTKLNFEPKPG
jgi:hypothetical protein